MEYELVYGLPKAEVLAQMAEELTEAAQAALKLRRAMDGDTVRESCVQGN